MANYQERLRRPVKYSFGQAMGEAVQGAGQYFGALGIEKRKAENLALAREQKLQDRDELREHNAELVTEARTYAEQQAEEARLTALADKELALLNAEDERDGNIARTQSISGADLINKLGDDAPAEGIDPAQVYEVNINGEGDIKDYHSNTDYAVEGGKTVKLSAGGKGDAENKLTESTRKGFILAPQGHDAVAAYAQVVGIDMDTGRASGKGDVTAERSLTNTFYEWAGEGRFTNMIVPDDNQRSNIAQQNMMIIMRNFVSGAAFTKDETPVYLGAYVPQSSDSPEIKALKLMAYEQLMDRIGDINLNSPSGQKAAQEAASNGLLEMNNIRLELFSSDNNPTQTNNFTEIDNALDAEFGGKGYLTPPPN